MNDDLGSKRTVNERYCSDELISPEAIRDELGRLLASAEFKASPRRRQMLAFVVEETLAGRGHELKGYTIGVSVFGRGEEFDAQSDPVVRIEARRLRRDLASYYISAGRRNPVRISIPTGHYLPEIHRAVPDGSVTGEDIVDTAGSNEIADQPGGAVTQITDNDDERVRKWPRLVIAILLLVFPFVIYSIYTFSDWWRDEAASAGAQGPVLLVLPFDVDGEDADVAFLAVGFTEQLIAELNRFSYIRLHVPRIDGTKAESLVSVGTKKHQTASFALTGSVNMSVARVRIGAQLIDIESGRVIWAEQFDRPLRVESLMAAQSSIATAIATALGQPYGVIQSEMSSRIRDSSAPSLPSYECVLRAYSYRRNFAVENHGPVLACLEAAVQQDPEFADAWAMLGWLHMDAARFNLVGSGEVNLAYVRALAAASQALVLDSENVLALKVLASINHYIGSFGQSEQLQRRALDLNPNDSDTLAQLGWRLAIRGRFREGLPYLEQAIERSANPPGWYYHLIAIDHYMNRRYARMLRTAKKSTADGSSISWSLVAIARGALGDEAAASQALEQMMDRSPSFYRDPAAVYRRHQATEEIVDALIDGLRKAGWTETGTPRLTR